MTEKEYPIGGYAPGSYQCKCAICGDDFQGDKRAVQCKPCALRDREVFEALSDDEKTELIKRNSELISQHLVTFGINKN